MKTIKLFLSVFCATLSLQAQEISKDKLSIIAESNHQWTGIAMSQTNRMFVNFPRWSADTPVAVAEIINGKIHPFPDANWNMYEENPNHFTCVQSVFVDKANRLWVLDTGYELEKDKTKGGKLFVFDLQKNELTKTYDFPVEAITDKSYLNDFRVDEVNNKVYLTDSRLGGLVVLDLKTKEVRRILASHPSTLAEVPEITIEGIQRKKPVHSDGIELDKERKYLYYCSLTGENVYRIPVKYIVDEKYNDAFLGAKVEQFAKTGANDGIAFDGKGNLYLSSLEKNGISVVDKNGTFKTIITDGLIQWPDSLSFGNGGVLYFTTSLIHLPKDKRPTYKVFRLDLK
ncbi:major royal jelly family protein [Flavobacterium amniphilum]|uniref:SMP-30/gluconolactonase/LRE family protein n=1 Tax=Flavobacterium amniphilum TaxID=1834035 RepID=UPI00202A5473|nr:major royal jelly family protein [Flavobacterium amniphilum]MCL9807618.1 major royal jelly family protein [Flavobacterium amniphilum]